MADIRTRNAKGSREGDLSYYDVWDGEHYKGWVMACSRGGAKRVAQTRWPDMTQVRVLRAISDD